MTELNVDGYFVLRSTQWVKVCFYLCSYQTKLSLYSDIFHVEVHLPLLHFDVHSCVLVEINFANKTS